MALANDRLRPFAADFPTIEIRLPVKAGQTILMGAVLELNGGYLENAVDAGVFAGFAMDRTAAVSGESDGDRTLLVRVQGAVEVDVSTETAEQADVGVATTLVEATDNDTFRIERSGAPIAGVPLGPIARVLSSSRVVASFKGAMVA